MSMRYPARARKGAAAAMMAAVLVVSAAACSDNGDGDSDKGSSQASSSDKQGDQKTDTGPDTSQKLAELKGPGGIVLTVHSLERDSGGFVTLNATMKNTTNKAFYDISAWRGTEKETTAGGLSVAGATLVDSKGKKRYYMLRDTDGRCLCSSGLDKVDAGKSLPIFMQFPAPPESTTEVNFQFPTFPNATLKISG